MGESPKEVKKKEFLQDLLERFGIALVALLMFVIFSVLSSKFCSSGNIFNVFKQISIIAILSIGMTFVFMIGGMDLSAGSNVMLGAVVTAALLQSGKASIVPAMCIALILCMIMGMLNGMLIEVLKINCVIVTLGSQLAIRGLALVIIKRYNSWIWMKDPLLKFVNTGTVLGIPFLFLLVLILYLGAWVAFHRTAYGRQVYAVGGNEKTARLCGINTVRVKVICYVISGLTAGLAGIVAAARLGMVSTTVGIGMEFEAVTAVVLGGASLKGGEGNVLKTLIGAVIVGMIANFMTLFGVDANYQSAVTGAFILFAAIFNRMTQRDVA
ncbi:MAG: ABC transporter permease [Eubacteriales bacterium]|nr:ABC transporter permease [Eubacteriales bacterium]